MAFPQVSSVTTTAFATAAVNHNVSMPATVAANDLLVMVFANQSTFAPATPSGWSSLRQTVGANVVATVYMKKAAGTEGGTTVNVATTGSSTEAAAHVYRITGWNAAGTLGTTATAVSTFASATNTQPNPPSLDPASWATEDTLWIAAFGMQGSDSISSYPTNYTTGTFTRSSTSGFGASVGSARRENAVSAEDPSVFTTSPSGGEWLAITIAIRPNQNISVTPGVASLTTTKFAPTVAASDNKSVTPSTKSLTLSTFAPSATVNVRVSPNVAGLTIAAFAPTVTATANQTATPGVASLTLTTYAPTPTIGARLIPGAATLTLTTYAPTVVNPVSFTPGVAALALTAYAPTATVVLPPGATTATIAAILKDTYRERTPSIAPAYQTTGPRITPTITARRVIRGR